MNRTRMYGPVLVTGAYLCTLAFVDAIHVLRNTLGIIYVPFSGLAFYIGVVVGARGWAMHTIHAAVELGIVYGLWELARRTQHRWFVAALLCVVGLNIFAYYLAFSG